MRSSAMRDLMAITARPEVISLAGGLPDTSTFPSDSFAAQMTRIAHESSAEALQYGPTEGFEETKECILEVMGAEGMAPDPDDLIVTTGGQQAIDLITKTLVNPGDPVICEAPTYPGAVPTFCSYEADVHQVSTDDEGMRIDELEELLGALATAGRRPKFIYSVPSFQNPAGVTLSEERRRRLVELAREHEVLVVEDNPYGLLRYDGVPEPTLYSLDGGDYVLYLGTLSKILSPGIRIGWVAAPPPVLEKIGLGKQAADLCTSTLTPVLRPRVLRRGPLARVHRGSRRDLPCAARRDARRARAPLPGSGRVDAAPRAACSSGRPSPITSTRPTCLRKPCARTSPSSRAGPPTSTDGAAPRCASTSRPRTRMSCGRAFAGSARSSPSRSALYESITGEHRILPPEEEDDGSGGEVVPLPRR